MQQVTSVKKVLAWLVWSVVGCFYFYEISLRMLPSIMNGYYFQLFSIDATSFSLFTSIYYISYTLMQVPAGLIVDHFSLRKVLFIASLMCILGFFITSNTHNFNVALLGRLIIGFGSAFAYVSALKAATLWLPSNRFGFASCLLDSLGMLGAVFTDLVLVKINLTVGIPVTLYTLLLMGVGVTALIYFVLPRRPRLSAKTIPLTKDLNQLAQHVFTIFKNKQLWLIGVVSALFYLPSSVVGDVWGVPYLESVYHYSKSGSTMAMTVFFIAWALLGPVIGFYSDRYRSRIAPILWGLFFIMASFSVLIFLPMTHLLLPYGVVILLFFVIGTATGAHPLVFALAKEQFSPRIAGTVVAATNMLTMLGGLVFQPVIGILLDYHHRTPRLHHVIHYTSSDYSYAFTILPILLVLAIIGSLFLRNKPHCPPSQTP